VGHDPARPRGNPRPCTTPHYRARGPRVCAQTERTFPHAPPLDGGTTRASHKPRVCGEITTPSSGGTGTRGTGFRTRSRARGGRGPGRPGGVSPGCVVPHQVPASLCGATRAPGSGSCCCARRCATTPRSGGCCPPRPRPNEVLKRGASRLASAPLGRRPRSPMAAIEERANLVRSGRGAARVRAAAGRRRPGRSRAGYRGVPTPRRLDLGSHHRGGGRGTNGAGGSECCRRRGVVGRGVRRAQVAPTQLYEPTTSRRSASPPRWARRRRRSRWGWSRD
jgi:hypothetical protein